MHGFAGRCLTTRPLHRWGLMPFAPSRADDGIRTRDPHLGKVMLPTALSARSERDRRFVAMVDTCRSVAGDTILRGLMPLTCAFSRRNRGDLHLRMPSVPRPLGPVAQWKSVRFTRGRSLV